MANIFMEITFFSWASTDRSKQAKTATTTSHLNFICFRKKRKENQSFNDLLFLKTFGSELYGKRDIPARNEYAPRMVKRQLAITLPESCVWASQIYFFFPRKISRKKREETGEGRDPIRGVTMVSIYKFSSGKEKMVEQTKTLTQVEMYTRKKLAISSTSASIPPFFSRFFLFVYTNLWWDVVTSITWQSSILESFRENKEIWLPRTSWKKLGYVLYELGELIRNE